MNKLFEELRNVCGCLDEQPPCGAFLFADFSRGGRKATAILTAPKPLQDKALSKGGGG